MADVRPFRGIRFDPARVNVSTVLCPPFDVIAPAEQEAYHARDPHNVIRLELGLGNPDPEAPDNWYQRAAQTLHAWLEEGALVQDGEPAMYLYEHRFTYRRQERVRHGLLVAGRLHDWSEGVVLPHEGVRKGPIQSRLALLHAARANVSPLWLVYDDPQHEVITLLVSARQAAPLAEAEVEGERHVLRALRDPDTVRAVADHFAGRRLYVADGHHRYHTAQRYRDEQRQQALAAGCAPDPAAGYEFALMLLVALDDPGMLLLPTHRLVRGLERPLRAVREHLARWFTLTPLAVAMGDDAAAGAAIERALAEAGREGHAFGLLEQDGAWLLRLRAGTGGQTLLPPERSAAWRDLDVVLLDTLAIREVCGIEAEAEAGHADATSHGAADRLTYVSDFAAAVRAVRTGVAQQAYLLNPTRIEQVCAVAEARETMPPKSTFFAPKPLTGLVLHALEGTRPR
jgi:uncharacterized protein (DUF1015 family)